jgi:4-aminobutyrate aminotransferase-like enzyme
MRNSIHDIEIVLVVGSTVHTSDGRSLVDFTSGIFAASLGMGDIDVGNAICEQSESFMHCYEFGHPIKQEYHDRLCAFTGFEAAQMFSSGTEAVEAAYKIARRYTGKNGIWGLEHAFHGKTLGAQIAAGREVDWRNQTAGEKTGCLIFEPYNALTCQFHKDKTIERIKHLVKTFDLILIADEIQAGFGRTGKLFGYQHYYDLNPDIVCVGKAMCNGFPASAILGPSVLINNPMMDLSSTNGWNPLACAAGLEVINQFETFNLVKRAEEIGRHLQEGLCKLTRPVQGKGMVASIYFESTDDADKAVVDLCAAGLLVVHTKAQTVKIGPPLNITMEDLNKGIAIIRKVIG